MRGAVGGAVIVKWLSLFAVAASACVDPLVSDSVDRSALVLPPGTTLPSAEDDPALAERIDANDGIDGDVVWALEGYLDGEAVTWWDFGAASPLPIPLYMLVEEDPEGWLEGHGKRWSSVPDHPPIFDKIVGDAGYSPWWTLVLVPVTERYQGEVLPSFAAVEAAEQLGLVEMPIPLDAAVNCPVVLPSARLERVPGGPLEEPGRAYFRGYEVHYFSFDMIGVEGASVPVSTVYQLRREGGEPLSERVRGVDISGDGDAKDTNDVFLDGPGDAGYSGMVELVDVVVAADTRAIDDKDGTQVRGVDDLFDRDLGGGLVPDPARVVAVYPVRGVLNRPIAPPPDEE
ncbi:MAG: hypothetical protein IT385_10285 [Deltaproteobacteria bacterium]|nr:hypothetical protein [Deltaproteobacteria bacterium]